MVSPSSDDSLNVWETSVLYSSPVPLHFHKRYSYVLGWNSTSPVQDPKTSLRSWPSHYYLGSPTASLWKTESKKKVIQRESPVEWTKNDLPSSFRPLNAGARSLILPGSCSRMPMGMYRYWKESASQRYRRVAFTPVVSDPKWLRNESQKLRDNRKEKTVLQPILCVLKLQSIMVQLRI